MLLHREKTKVSTISEQVVSFRMLESHTSLIWPSRWGLDRVLRNSSRIELWRLQDGNYDQVIRIMFSHLGRAPDPVF